MGRLCYITRNYYHLRGAGNKAKTDNEATLKQMGAVNLGLPTTICNSKVVAFVLNIIGLAKFALCLRKGDVLFLQYPIKKYFSFVCRVARFKKARTIVVIHDLMSKHRKRVSEADELKALSVVDYVIASNEQMKQWFEERGIDVPVGSLGLFDYRSDAEASDKDIAEPHRWSLVYAGSITMRKNPYLLKLAQQTSAYDLHIYGNVDNVPGLKDIDSVVCHPFTPADDFISSAEGDFGLVWDGDSLDTCRGDFGEYLKYNSPHKVSFYIRAGLPVIIWRQAAVASIIEKEKIGFCIDTIDDIEKRLQSLSASEYAEMKSNVRRVSDKLKEGGFLKEALDEAYRRLEL